MTGILGIAAKGFTNESSKRTAAMILKIRNGEAVKRFNSAKTPAASSVGMMDEIITGITVIGSFAGDIKTASLIQPVALPM